jgi:FixJ family two-component response regulator
MTPQPDPETIVYVLDDNADVCNAVSMVLSSAHLTSLAFTSVSEFWQHEMSDVPSCLICDVRLPNASGLDVARELHRRGFELPVIFTSAYGDIKLATDAMKQGAVEFLEKPFREQDLLDAVQRALGLDRKRRETDANTLALRGALDALTVRERTTLQLIAQGLKNREIAREMAISITTVKMHRFQIRKKLGTKSAVGLAQMAIALKADDEMRLARQAASTKHGDWPAPTIAHLLREIDGE